MRTMLLFIAICFYYENLWAQGLVLHGLSADKALVSVHGRHEMLRYGHVSRSGVRLRELAGQEALVEWRGQRYRLSLNRRINSRFVDARAEVALHKRNGRAFIAPLSINGQNMESVLDTGATVIAMNHRHARKLGIDYLKGQRGKVTTASGQAEAWFVQLNRVDVGGVVVQGVRASVVEGNYPVEILLGMSFLNHVTMQERQGVLYLREKD